MAGKNYGEASYKNVYKPIVLVTVVMLAILFFYIPYITDKNTIQTIKLHSITAVEQMKLNREYYVQNVVADIKQYAPQKVTFSYEHEGLNGVIPLPTTTIHDLSEIFSENTGIKYNLYSKFPFKNREYRILTKFQEEALEYTNSNPEGIYSKRDIIDGKPYLRVAVTDYMTQQSCVDCHNSHPDRTWKSDKWKLGDKRGIIEVITPLEDNIKANNFVKYSILSLIVVSIVLLLVYLFFTFLRRERKFTQVIDETNEALQYEIEISDEQKSLLKEHKRAIDLSAIVSKTDINGNIIYVNDEFCKITGYSRNEILGKNHRVLKNPDNIQGEYKRLWEEILAKRVYKGTLKNSAKSGEEYYIDETIVPILDKDENIIEFLALSYNVTEHIQSLNYAYTDQLTGVSNRHKFEEVYMYQSGQTKRNRSNFCLVILDIDHFKSVNDTFGHLEGDRVLVEIAQTIKDHMRESDFFARWGGEEFILLLNNVSLVDAVNGVEKFRVAVKNLKFDIVGTVTASFGVTEYEGSDCLADTIKRADEALYQAKHDGRNCIRSK